MSEPHCSKCKATDVKLIKSSQSALTCNPCNTARLKAYRQTAAGKKAVYEAVKRYNAKNKTRLRAWQHAGRHIAKQPCEVCGETNTDRHHDDPSKALEVMHLCRIHHRARHQELKLLTV